MEKNFFVVSNEIIQGVVSAGDNDELKTKLPTLLDGIIGTIIDIELPEFNDLNDMEPHDFYVSYEESMINVGEVLTIQKVNIV